VLATHNVALKEWAIVDEWLGSGRQVVLLRKGGIHEQRGQFEVEHREFFLFPTYVHQKADDLVPMDPRAFVEAMLGGDGGRPAPPR